MLVCGSSEIKHVCEETFYAVRAESKIRTFLHETLMGLIEMKTLGLPHEFCAGK
jgi:hypothetical protein